MAKSYRVVKNYFRKVIQIVDEIVDEIVYQLTVFGLIGFCIVVNREYQHIYDGNVLCIIDIYHYNHFIL